MGLYEILKASKLGAGAAPDMYTALFAQKISKGGSGGEAELSGVPPLTFPADGTPLLDYLISGNTTQSGTPTPDNPIMPQGTGERTGNLWDGDYTVAVMSVSGNTAMLNITSSGRTAIVKCESNTTYTVKKYSASNRFIIAESDIRPVNGTVMSIIQNDSSISEYTFTTSNTTQYVAIYCSTSSEQAEPQLILNLGSTALPYEPYGYKIPISSAGQTNNIYLGEAQSTRRIKKYEFTGTESEDVLRMPVVNLFYYKVQNGLPLNSGGCRCTHYINNQVPNIQLNNGEVKLDVTNVWGSTANVIVFKDTSKATLEDFKTWLQQQYASGTPVTVWYALVTSETSAINEPLMRIGDYADTLSKSQAGVAIPTNNGSTTVDVDTTVKPSEIYIKYRT